MLRRAATSIVLPRLPAERVALGYVDSVDGTQTGSVIDAGWRFDTAGAFVSVAGAATLVPA